MKKKILFIISNMETGGVSKSMSTLLNVIDTKRYNVDCFILNPTGVFMDLLPQDVKVITNDKMAVYFSKFPNNIITLVTRGWFYLAIIRLLSALVMLVNKGWGGYLLSKGIPALPTVYDLAVDYNGQHQLYYLVDKVKAKKKVSFFHSDYKKWPYYYSADKKYYPKVDKIFTISPLCVDSLKETFPQETSKIDLMENMSSIDWITRRANEEVDDKLTFNGLKIITVGHISEAKGTLLALKAAVILKERKQKFKWYFLGQKDRQLNFDQLVTEYGLEDEVVTLGTKANPYPYIQQADLVVHPSLFEGKSIALDEAKILCKPIVVTNFSTVYDQFQDRVNASICTMDPLTIANSIIELSTDQQLCTSYIKSLLNNRKDNTSEITKLYQLIENN